MRALRTIVAEEIYVPGFLFETPNEEAFDGPMGGSLTARQQEILALLADGMQNKLIADALGISEGTVKQHLKSIYKRLQVQNRTQAVRAAQRMGLIERKSASDLSPK